MTKYTLRPIEGADQALVAQLVTESWGAPRVVIGRGRLAEPSLLPGPVAEEDGEVVGLLTYYVNGYRCRKTSSHAAIT